MIMSTHGDYILHAQVASLERTTSALLRYANALSSTVPSSYNLLPVTLLSTHLFCVIGSSFSCCSASSLQALRRICFSARCAQSKRLLSHCLVEEVRLDREQYGLCQFPSSRTITHSALIVMPVAAVKTVVESPGIQLFHLLPVSRELTRTLIPSIIT